MTSEEALKLLDGGLLSNMIRKRVGKARKMVEKEVDIHIAFFSFPTKDGKRWFSKMIGATGPWHHEPIVIKNVLSLEEVLIQTAEALLEMRIDKEELLARLS